MESSLKNTHIGQKFHMLTVISNAGSDPYNHKLWLCKCNCGNKKIIYVRHVKSGVTKSCGCLKAQKTKETNTKHGKSYSKEYIAWASMIQRCTNINSKHYFRYGGRGIKVCNSWINSFENFYKDMGNCPIGLTLERIDNNSDYEPLNCKWATRREQAKNRRSNKYITYLGHTKTIKDWSVELGIKEGTLGWRIRMGWSTERALAPKRKESVK